MNALSIERVSVGDKVKMMNCLDSHYGRIGIIVFLDGFNISVKFKDGMTKGKRKDEYDLIKPFPVKKRRKNKMPKTKKLKAILFKGEIT
jgi:hypothetical protein